MNREYGEVRKAKRSLTDRAFDRLTQMDRTEELCLVTAALCAFGTALAAQARHS